MSSEIIPVVIVACDNYDKFSIPQSFQYLKDFYLLMKPLFFLRRIFSFFGPEK
jgi:hypothetical protein